MVEWCDYSQLSAKKCPLIQCGNCQGCRSHRAPCSQPHGQLLYIEDQVTLPTWCGKRHRIHQVYSAYCRRCERCTKHVCRASNDFILQGDHAISSPQPLTREEENTRREIVMPLGCTEHTKRCGWVCKQCKLQVSCNTFFSEIAFEPCVTDCMYSHQLQTKNQYCTYYRYFENFCSHHRKMCIHYAEKNKPLYSSDRRRNAKIRCLYCTKEKMFVLSLIDLFLKGDDQSMNKYKHQVDILNKSESRYVYRGSSFHYQEISPQGNLIKSDPYIRLRIKYTQVLWTHESYCTDTECLEEDKHEITHIIDMPLLRTIRFEDLHHCDDIISIDDKVLRLYYSAKLELKCMSHGGSGYCDARNNMNAVSGYLIDSNGRAVRNIPRLKVMMLDSVQRQTIFITGLIWAFRKNDASLGRLSLNTLGKVFMHL